MREYDDEGYCDNCEDWTPQTFHDSEHERDSSGDWQKCHRCGYTYYGLTGEWEPPETGQT